MMPGLDVIVSKALPLHPGPGEVARRIVRHGLADVLAWLGEKVGPKPEDLTHAIAGMDPAGPVGGVLFVSAEYAERLRRESTVLADLGHPDRARRSAAEAAWLRTAREHQAQKAAARRAVDPWPV